MNYDTIDPEISLGISELTHFVNQNLITSKGTLAPYFARPSVIASRPDLMRVCGTLRAMFPHATGLAEAIYCLLKGKPTGCQHCGQPTGFIHMGKGYRPFCSSRCNATHHTPSKFLTEEQRQTKSEKMSCALKGRKMSVEWRQALSTAAKRSDVKHAKAKTCKERYGVENPGVLGAFSSRAATDFIKRFLAFMEIDEDRCMFKAEGKREFYQNIVVSWSDKQRYVSYDLVVFRTHEGCVRADMSDIELVLEYQGPWHYRPWEVMDERQPATPYPNSLTKAQILEIDDRKRYAFDGSIIYLLYWADTATFNLHTIEV